MAKSICTLPCLGPHGDAHPGLEVVAEQLLELEEARRPQLRRARAGGGGLRRAAVGPGADRLLDVAHREVVLHGALRELLLERAIRGPEERARVAHPQRAVLHVPLDRRRELEQPEHVGDRRPGLADPLGHLVVREVEVLDQLLVGRRLLQRVQLLALDVLDDGLLQHRGVVGVPDDGGDRLEADPAGGPPATLAGDELEGVALLPDEHRLEDAHLPDRLGEGREALLVEVLARLLGVGPDRGDGDLLEPGATVLDGPRGDEGAEPLTQSAGSRHG
ncbi:MAG: hypothetical protein KatS3mg010_1353 [Acidimicrobiia bacterium]|nr:MAG: hypothetical protein KatS3mg010_1353 [Acidimicrobiia bacterium]